MSGFFWVIILVPVVFAIGTAIQASMKKSSFSSLGNVRGLSKFDIISRVGQPTSVSVIGPDQTLMQWQTIGYHISLSFTGEICDGITHEYSTNGTGVETSSNNQLNYQASEEERKRIQIERDEWERQFLALGDDDEINNDEIEENSKKCPFCAEYIKKEAILCRFCGKDLSM